MADGIRLETVICLPRGRGPWPIILKRSCYPNQQVEMDWYADVFTCRGFGLVYQWCRGTAGSEGDWEPNVHERADGLATVEWLTGQPYTKNIGFWGDSYLGLTGWCMLDAVPESVKSMYLGVYGVDRHTSAYKDGLFRQDVLTTWAAGNTGSAIPEGVSQMDSCRYRPQEEVDEKLWGVHLDWYRDWISHPDRSSHYWSEGFWGMLKEIPTKAKIPVYIRDGWYDHHLGSAIVSYDSLSEESKAHSVLQIGPWNHGYIPVIPFEDTKNLEDDALDSVFQWFYETLVKEKKPEGAVREYVIGEDRWIEKKERAQCTETRSFYFGNGTLDAQPGQDGTLSYEYDPENPVPSHGTEAMLAHSEEQGSLAQPQPGARPDVISFVSEPLAEGFTTDGVIEVVLYAASDAEDTAFTAKVMEVFPDGTAVNVRGSITTLAYRNGADKRLTYMPGEKVELRIPMWDIAWHFREGSRIRVDISSSDFPQYAVHSNYPGVWSKQSRTKIAEQTLYYGGGSPSEVRFPLIKK
ncbi:MAG: CocE/NonD family hydrolase [Eubacteriales bacterium]|nr:CocE/NonD family hydrolase [Eubacteriales bacterium]